MVQAKREHQFRARELRRAGMTYDEIVDELGVSKSSVSLWVRDLPSPRRPMDREAVRAHMDMMRSVRLANIREHRAKAVEQARSEGRAEVGTMSDRELLLVGAGLYWAEGGKSKPYRISERVVFINGDPDMIRIFQAWLYLLGVEPERVRYHLMIHETADVAEAERYWRDVTGAPRERFTKTTLKRHDPKTIRKNVGEGYHGCLSLRVLQSADLYRRIEGWWYGIVETVERRGDSAHPTQQSPVV